MTPEKIISPETGKAKLDEASLRIRAGHLPEIMRESFMWLGTHCRERCGGDVSLLHEQFLKLGIRHDVTTWSKILRGMWQRDNSGNPTASPCLAQDKFLKAVAALQSDSRIKELGGRIPTVITPTVQDIWNAIETVRAPDAVNKFLIVVGETGSQKTASFKEYSRRNPSCPLIDSPATPSMAHFMTDFADCFGYAASASYLRKQQYVLEIVGSGHVVIVENVQRLYRENQGENQPIFSFLQKLQEDTNCVIVISLTPVFAKKLSSGAMAKFFEQFIGRAGGERAILTLPEYPPQEDLVMIAQAYGLVDAEDHGPYLDKMAKVPGRIRAFFHDLQQSKIKAAAANEKLTINHIIDMRRDLRGEK